MKIKLSLGFISAIILFVGINLVIGDYNILSAKESFIVVTLKDKTSIKFQNQSFSLNWVDKIVIDEYSCDPTPFELEDVKDIYVMSLKEYTCGGSDRDSRLFDVHLLDGREIMGFIELSETYFSGVLLDTGEHKSIPYRDIKRIRFVR